jgi:hypothetical protein
MSVELSIAIILSGALVILTYVSNDESANRLSLSISENRRNED